MVKITALIITMLENNFIASSVFLDISLYRNVIEIVSCRREYIWAHS